MTIPTRWHEPSCKTPQVVVDGNFPECRSCGSNASALLRRAAEQAAPSYSGINLPPETPIGQMDLFWPPCVPYTRNGVPRAQLEVPSEDPAILTPLTSGSTLSDIYPSSLGRDHFRLLYLSGSRLIDNPIHGDLVEYLQHNCPEYETTSYTWGGEDGDATPCKPAYFGKFWDMLFITRNCWSLLQYLRPEMGTRVVWVDAVCINQNDLPERGTQVSSMPQIYRNCMRVVIYPGDHLVRRNQHEFRQRIRHDEIVKDDDVVSEDDSRFDIWGSVLQGRYITRVWIIQELILAPHWLLALRHHDLDLSNDLLHRVSQRRSGRSWLEYVGQDYKLRQITLIEGLQMTSDNQATDPRDRIFGILGILRRNPAYSEIVPDYSISMRDCVIGAMGLTLTISNEIWPLLHVHTSESPWEYPSWVPDLDEVAVATVEPPPRHNFRGFDNREGYIADVPGSWSTSVHLDFTPGGVGAHMLRVRSEMPWWQDASIDSGSGALKLRLVRMFDKPHKITTMERETSDWEILDEYHFSVEGASAVAWFSSTKLPQKPEQPCYIFLAFYAQNASTKEVARVRPPQSDICIVFATEGDVSGTFSMVQCFPLDDVVCASVSSPPPPQPSLRFWELEAREDNDSTIIGPYAGVTQKSYTVPSYNKGSVMSLFETLHLTLDYNTRKHTLQYCHHHHDLPCAISILRGMRLISKRAYNRHNWNTREGTVSEAMLFDMIVPGKGNSASGLLQLSLSAGRAGSPFTVTKEFIKAYAECLQTTSAEFNPVLDEEYVWFTFTDDESLGHYWNSVIKHISDAETSRREHDQWLPWNILFPTWFDLQIPGIGKTLFNEDECGKSKPEPSDSELTMQGKDPYKDYTPSSDRCSIALPEDYEPQSEDPDEDDLSNDDRCALHEDYESQDEDPDEDYVPNHDRCALHDDYEPQGDLNLKYWLPCAAEPKRLQMPVKARMPLSKVVEAIRKTELNWLHRHLMAFGEQLGEDAETLLERGPQPEDCNLYLQEWRPESLVKELGFVWRKELVTFV